MHVALVPALQLLPPVQSSCLQHYWSGLIAYVSLNYLSM